MGGRREAEEGKTEDLPGCGGRKREMKDKGTRKGKGRKVV